MAADCIRNNFGSLARLRRGVLLFARKEKEYWSPSDACFRRGVRRVSAKSTLRVCFAAVTAVCRFEGGIER